MSPKTLSHHSILAIFTFTFTSISVEILLPPSSHHLLYLLTTVTTLRHVMASPNFSNWNPHDWIFYGPNENCTLALCPVEYSVYEYRPSLAANISFIVLFGISLLIHLYQGFRWRTWAFMIAIFLGCACEMVGYGGRIILWQNPFSFPGFISQIGGF